MRSQTKKRLLTGLLFVALAGWSVIAVWPSHFGFPVMAWLVIEAALVAGVLSVVAFAVAEWAGRDD